MSIGSATSSGEEGLLQEAPGPSPARGTAESFRLLALRLKGQPQPEPPPPPPEPEIPEEPQQSTPPEEPAAPEPPAGAPPPADPPPADPPLEVSRALAVSRELAISHELEISRELEISHERERDRARERDREREIAHELELAREQERARERELSRELELAREREKALEQEIAREREKSRELEKFRELEIARERELAHELETALVLEKAREAQKRTEPIKLRKTEPPQTPARPPVQTSARPNQPAPSRHEEAATLLLDTLWGAAGLPPQERALAGDALLVLLPRLRDRQLATLAERICGMAQPPALLVARLLQDPRPEIGGIILERCPNLRDDDVIAASALAGSERLIILARRRGLSPAVADHLVASADLLTLIALLRNTEAQLSFDAFRKLAGLAARHAALQPPLAARPDLPLAIALDLFWHLTPDLRRAIFSRFLSDSGGLNRVLGTALAAGKEADAPDPPDGSLPSSEEIEAALEPLLKGRLDLAAPALARLAGVTETTLRRILADEEGEALVALFKALGLTRRRFDAILDKIRVSTGLVKPTRIGDELKAVFDALSYNKARVLLIYWDWAARKEGPYAPDP